MQWPPCAHQEEQPLAVIWTDATSCKACSLGTDSKLRALPVGSPQAPIMLLGGDRRSQIVTEPGVGGHARAYGLTSAFEPPGGAFVPRWLRGAGLDPDLFYSTCALRCKSTGAQVVSLHGTQTLGIVPCLQRHLGQELEEVQPAVVVAFGELAEEALRCFWATPFRQPIKPAPDLLVWTMPAYWRFETLTLVRGPELQGGLVLSEGVASSLLDRAKHFYDRTIPRSR